jgi:NADPH-dependent curcumin reductase CurA
MTRVNRQWRLARRPAGLVEPTDFTWHEVPVPPLEHGQVLVRQLLLSLDPTNRVWAATDSYLPAVELGAVMRGIGVGLVEESRLDGFAPGDLVQGMLGWQAYEVSSGRGLSRLARLPGVDPSMFLHVLGHIGLTAWVGVVDIGRLQAGETMVVSAAAGAVGSLAVQIGKLLDAHVVGIAGGPEKCRWLTDGLGIDAAIDYKSEPVRKRLRTTCPRGIDVLFENVGGPLLEAGLSNLALHGRVALCGMISQYTATSAPSGPANLHELIARRARIEGFLVSDHLARAQEAFAQLGGWLREGRLQARVTIVEGLELAPATLNRLFDGSHDGKLMIRVS